MMLCKVDGVGRRETISVRFYDKQEFLRREKSIKAGIVMESSLKRDLKNR